MLSQCLGTNRDGNPCSAMPDPGASWCRWHAPDREAERKEWRRKGGAARSNRARARKQLTDALLTINDLDGLLCRALVQVAAGALEPGVGSAMSVIARTITTIRSAGELEHRLEELERQAGMTRMGRIGG